MDSDIRKRQKSKSERFKVRLFNEQFEDERDHVQGPRAAPEAEGWSLANNQQGNRDLSVTVYKKLNSIDLKNELGSNCFFQSCQIRIQPGKHLDNTFVIRYK